MGIGTWYFALVAQGSALLSGELRTDGSEGQLSSGGHDRFRKNP